MRYLILLLVLFPSLVMAEDSAVGIAVAGLWSGVVVPVIASLCLGLLGLVLDKLRKKYNLQISSETQAYLGSIAERGIALAEERGAAYIKANVMKITGRDKLDIAIAHVLESAPKVTREQADTLVHAALARLQGAGATGDKAL